MFASFDVVTKGFELQIEAEPSLLKIFCQNGFGVNPSQITVKMFLWVVWSQSNKEEDLYFVSFQHRGNWHFLSHIETQYDSGVISKHFLR